MTQRRGSDIERVFGGVRHRPPDTHRTGSVFEGVIHSVDPKGAYFTVPDWDDGKHKFGPCPWPRTLLATSAVGDHGTHDHEGDAPTVGARCLVQSYYKRGEELFWIVGWWPS